MGQYYMPLLIGKDKKIQRFYSHHYNNGLKLMEHSWIGNNFVNAVLGQLWDEPKRVVWVGDYSETVDQFGMGDGFVKNRRSFSFYYRKAWGEKACTPLVDDAEQFPLDIDRCSYYLVNLTKGCYIDLQHYVEDNLTKGWDGTDWCVNPLPLLTCVGNGQGGGDYFSPIGAKDVGTWAFDEIYISETCPVGMREVHFCFQEN